MLLECVRELLERYRLLLEQFRALLETVREPLELFYRLQVKFQMLTETYRDVLFVAKVLLNELSAVFVGLREVFLKNSLDPERFNVELFF
jgi:hypothetical protein